MTIPAPVLVVSNHGEIVGGGEISLLGLLEGLDRARWAPAVVVPSEGQVACRTRGAGIPVSVIPMPGLRTPSFGVLRGVAMLYRLIRTVHACLLHANGSRAMIYAGLAGRLARRPVMWHVRVADPEPGLDRMLFALAQAVIVNSMAVGRRFPHPSHAKVHVIHNGVDLAHFSPRQPLLGLRSSLGISAGARIVGSVGRFVPYKGYSHLLEAARLVEHALPDTHWILAGDGEERPNLETQARKQGMQRQIHFAGWREDIPEILSLCDVFALPSLAEHFGRVLIEAMAMGKAVVATNAGGVPEIVTHGETGLLIPPGNSTALAEALLTLLQDPSLSARLGLAARRRAEACFSLSRHVEAVESVYGELSISRHGRV